MVTKFVVMCYIYSSAMPLLWGIVILVLIVSQFFDSRNLLRVMQPPPQSDEAAVKAILVYVMPLAVLGHLAVSYVMLNAVQDESEDDWFQLAVTELHATATQKLFNVSTWGQQISDTTTKVVQKTAATAGGGFTGLANLSTDVLGAFGQPEDDAVDMVWLSVLINGTGVLIFIYREWFREWRTPIDMLLKVPGAAIGFGAEAVRTVGGKVTEILPGEQLRLAAASGGAELKEEVGSLFTALREGVNEENAWQDEETRRRLQAAAATEEITYKEMIEGYRKAGFTATQQLYYAPPDRSELIAKIIDDKGPRDSKGGGAPISKPPSAGSKFLV